MSHLERRATLLLVAFLVGLATLAWALTVKQALNRMKHLLSAS